MPLGWSSGHPHPPASPSSLVETPMTMRLPRIAVGSDAFGARRPGSRLAA